MVQQAKVISGLYVNERNAKEACHKLESVGFSHQDIAMISRRKKGEGNFVYSLNTQVFTGWLIGSFIGFTFSLLLTLIFISVDTRLNQQQETLNMAPWAGFGLLFITSLLGLIFGGVAGALVGIGVPYTAKKRHEFYLAEGGFLVETLNFDNSDIKKTNNLFRESFADDIAVVGHLELNHRR